MTEPGAPRPDLSAEKNLDEVIAELRQQMRQLRRDLNYLAIQGFATPMSTATAPDGAQPLVQGGWVNITTNASALAGLAFPKSFPNGCLAVVCTSLNDVNIQLRVVQASTTVSGTQIVVRNNTGAGVANTTTAINYIALGW